jgi:hypothetical protein
VTASRIAIAAVCQPEAASPLKKDLSAAASERLALDIVTGDFGFTAAVPHADCQVVEPLDHDILLRLDLDHSLPSP